MAISPYDDPSTRVIYVKRDAMPLKTYGLDFEQGDLTGRFVEGRAALIQKVRKILSTARFLHPIYTSDYGCEVLDLVAQETTDAFLQEELPRLIQDALIHEVEVHQISPITVTREKSGLSLHFSIASPYGELPFTWAEGGNKYD